MSCPRSQLVSSEAKIQTQALRRYFAYLPVWCLIQDISEEISNWWFMQEGTVSFLKNFVTKVFYVMFMFVGHVSLIIIFKENK